MLLLEYKEKSDFKVSYDAEIIRNQSIKNKECEELFRIYNIKEFKNSRQLWMKKNANYYMKNNKDQGYSQVDWKGLTLSKHRR